MQAREQKFITLLIAIGLGLGLLSAACNKQSPQAERRAAAPAKPAPALSPLPVRPLSPELARMLERAKGAASATRELSWRGAARMTELTGWEYGRPVSRSPRQSFLLRLHPLSLLLAAA